MDKELTPAVSRPKTVAIQSPSATATQSPSKRPMIITLGQKQALIDNLQLESESVELVLVTEQLTYRLEVTERARKLRAQYALQAQSLRTRIELRVNRIPTAMRKANMGKLYDIYIESTKQPTEPTSDKSVPTIEAPKQRTSSAKAAQPSSPKPASTAPLSRGVKRTSDHFFPDDDKENTPDPTHPLSSKKRPKPNAHPSNPSMVLSPKSSNTRNMAPHSPVRAPLGSPQRSYLTHPASPLKPSGGFTAAKPPSPAKVAAVVAAATASSATTTVEKPRATRTRNAAATKPAKAPTKAAPKARAAPNTRAKRGAEAPVEAPNIELRSVSAASNTSTGTTVVRRTGKGAGIGGAAGAKAKAKKGAAAVPIEAPAQGRRVLRKRG
ncbi:MAG: hypothetical protein Q9170_001539 [Blastenia crenularia]